MEENKKEAKGAQKYTCSQACNLLKLYSVNRRVAIRKYEHEELSKKDWIGLLKEDKLL